MNYNQFRTNSKFLFKVKPSQGILQPNQSLQIKLTMQPLENYEPELFVNDQFQVLSVNCENETDLNQVWKIY